MNKIVLFIAIFASVAALGVFVYTEFVYQRPLPVEEEELARLQKETIQKNVPFMYKLDKITINIPSPTTRLRFVNLGIHLVLFKDEYKEDIDENKPLVYDIIIDVASKMKPDQLNSIDGKLLLEDRIKRAINDRLDKVIIKKILFSHYVVQ